MSTTKPDIRLNATYRLVQAELDWQFDQLEKRQRALEKAEFIAALPTFDKVAVATSFVYPDTFVYQIVTRGTKAFSPLFDAEWKTKLEQTLRALCMNVFAGQKGLKTCFECTYLGTTWKVVWS